MKKSIFDKEAVNEIISRVKKLKPDSKRNWGTFEATEMLHHCNIINKFNLESEEDNKKTTVKEKLIKTLVLRIIPNIPKNIKGAKELSRIDENKFEEEREKFIEIIKEFSERKAPIPARHPTFGKMTMKEWGVFTWMHMDHHLRQFGI